MICCPSASGAFRPITETRPALLSRWPPAARSDVETRPSDTLIRQQSHGAKAGAERTAEGEREMSGNEKSTDPGLSPSERKALRGSEAKEAMTDHEDAHK